MKPADVTEENLKFLKQIYAQRNKVKCEKKFKVNNFVRISKYKQLFNRGYSSAFTNEIFRIEKVDNTNPITYKLKYYSEYPVQGCFHNGELLHVEHPNFH